MTGLAMSPRTRKRVNARALDALTWLVLLVMLAPVLWLLIASTQTKLHLATGEIDFLHPTLKAFGDMWQTVDFEKYFVNSLIICGAAALVATAFAASAGYALARFQFRGARPFGLAVIGTQLDPRLAVPAAGVHGLHLAQAEHARAPVRHPARDGARLHRVLHAGGDLLHALVLPRAPA